MKYAVWTGGAELELRYYGITERQEREILSLNQGDAAEWLQRFEWDRWNADELMSAMFRRGSDTGIGVVRVSLADDKPDVVYFADQPSAIDRHLGDAVRSDRFCIHLAEGAYAVKVWVIELVVEWEFDIDGAFEPERLRFYRSRELPDAANPINLAELGFDVGGEGYEWVAYYDAKNGRINGECTFLDDAAVFGTARWLLCHVDNGLVTKKGVIKHN